MSDKDLFEGFTGGESFYRRRVENYLNAVQPAFAEELKEALCICENEGILMVPFFATRDLFEQARLWRQGRTLKQILQKRMQLLDSGAQFLAHVIASVGPQAGDRIVTNAAPGYSWHNWTRAMDFYRFIDGKSNWDTWEYKRFAEIIIDNGLTPGFYWKSQDAVHVQQEPLSISTHWTADVISLEMWNLHMSLWQRKVWLRLYPDITHPES